MAFIKKAAGSAIGVAAGLHVAPYALTLNAYTLSQYAKGLVMWPQLYGIGKPGHVALTFDDGPDAASTPKILDMLEELNWKATFFMLGEMTRRNPGVAKDVADRGHEIALHGYAHESYLRMPITAAIEDVKRARDVVESTTDREVTLFRPPYGTLSGPAVGAIYANKLQTVLWTAWGRDWERDTTPVRVAANVTNGVLNGGTVLLHDSDCASAPNGMRATLDALPLIADIFDKQNLTAGPLRDHF